MERLIKAEFGRNYPLARQFLPSRGKYCQTGAGITAARESADP